VSEHIPIYAMLPDQHGFVPRLHCYDDISQLSPGQDAYHHQDDVGAWVSRLTRERDEARAQLGNMLAVLNRDGGHYQHEHGIEAAINQGLANFHEARADAEDADALRKSLESLLEDERKKSDAATRRAEVAEKERDEAKMDFHGSLIGYRDTMDDLERAQTECAAWRAAWDGQDSAVDGYHDPVHSHMKDGWWDDGEPCESCQRFKAVEAARTASDEELRR